ncbi:remodeling and spacing factor 1 [Lissotriton helveticus]
MAAAEAAAETQAPVEEDTCPGSLSDFAVVCSFLERYGTLLELPEFTFPQLERVLRDTGPVPKILVELHLKLMRKIGKSVTLERWEKYLTRLCQDFNTTWAWEMEKKGYQEMTVECKLGMLRHLCECQFDDNVKFKNFINEEDADAMRLQPIGRDKDGLMYWYQLDQDHNIRMYIEEQDDQDGSSWKCIVRTRNELAETLELLKAQIDPSLLKKPEQQDGSSNDSPVPNEEDLKPQEENVPSKDEELSIKEEKAQEGLKEEKDPDQAIDQKEDGEFVKREKVDSAKEVVAVQIVKEIDEHIVKEKEEKKIIEDKVIEQSKETQSKSTILDNKDSIVKIEKSEEVESSETTSELLGKESLIESKIIKFTKEENDSFKENVKPVKVESKDQKDSDSKNRSDKVSEVERSEISVIVRCSPEVTEKYTEETEKLKNDQQAKIPLKKREIKLTDDFDSRSRGSMCKSVTPTKEMLREGGKVDDEVVKRTPICAMTGTDGKPLVNGEVSNGKLIPLGKTKTVIVNLCSTKEHISSKEENGIVGENTHSVIKSVATAKTENNVALVAKEVTDQGSEKYNHKVSMNIDSLLMRKQKGFIGQPEKTVGDFSTKGESSAENNPEVTTEKPQTDLLPQIKGDFGQPEKLETSLSSKQTATTLPCSKAPQKTLSSCSPPGTSLPSSELQKKPLASSEPPKKILFCSKPPQNTLSSSVPQEKPLSCKEPQEKPLSCAESLEKLVNCNESPEKTLFRSEPPEEPVSYSKQPEKALSFSEHQEKPLCCDEPPEKPIPCDDSLEKTVSCREPPEKPLSCSALPDKPSSFSEPPEKSASCDEQAQLIVTRKRGLRSRSKRKPNLLKTASACPSPPTALSAKGLLTEESIEVDHESSETKISLDGKLEEKTRTEKQQIEATKEKSEPLESVQVSNKEILPKTEKKTPLFKSRAKHRLPSEEENSGTESKEMTSERQKDGLKLTIRIANRKKKPDAPPDKESKDVKSLQMSEEFKTTKESKNVESLLESEGHKTKTEVKKVKSRQNSEGLKSSDITSLTKCDKLKGKLCPKMATSLPKDADLINPEEEEGSIGRSLRRSPRISRPSVKVVAVRDQNCEKKKADEEEKPPTQLPDDTGDAKPENEFLSKLKKPKSRRKRARWTVSRPRRNRKCSSEEESQDSASEANSEKNFKVKEDGQESSAPAEDDEPCKKCSLPNHPELILLCDSCDSGYHTACLRPPLMIIPDGEWYCPPCQHKLLCEKLEEQLQNLDVVLKKKERAERRKERLVYVGISLENIIPTQEAEIPEVQEVKKKDPKKVKPLERRSTRTRKCISYRFDEFDEAIDEAIEHDIRDSEEGGGGFGIGKDMANITAHCGKDMATILEEEKKESKRPQRVAVIQRKKRRRLNDLDSDSNVDDEDESEDEFRISDGSQDEFVVSDDNAESDDLQSNDSDGEIGARKPRRHYARPMRKSRRLRQKITKRKYSDDDEEEDTDDDDSPDESGSNYSEYSDDCLETRRRRSRRNSQRQVNYKEDSESDASKKSVRVGRGKEMRRILKRRHTSSDSNESFGSKDSENEVLRKKKKHSLRKLTRSSDDEPSEQENGAPIRKRINRIETDEENDDDHENRAAGLGNTCDEEKSVSAAKPVPPSDKEGTKKSSYRIESDDEDDFENVGKVESPLDYSLVDLPSTNGQSPEKTIENLIGKPGEKSQAPKDSTPNTSLPPNGTDNGQDVVAPEEDEDELLSVTDLVDYVCNSEQP